MSTTAPLSSLRAAGEGAMIAGFCGMPLPIAIAFVDQRAAIGIGAYLVTGMFMGGTAILIAHLAGRARRQAQMVDVDAQRLKDCEVMIQALQAGLMRCAGAAGPETLSLVSARLNEIVMIEVECQRKAGITPHWEKRNNQ